MGGRASAVGIDFGGTNIKVGVVDGRGLVVRKTLLLTRDHATPSAFVEGVSEAIKRLANDAGLGRSGLRGVGVGAPGLIDARRGLIHQLVNVPGRWRHVPLAKQLARRLRCPCALDNDVNVTALGEWRFGAGRGTRHSVYVTLGTGVGGGLVINGRLIRGAASTAGEIGHMTISLDGPRCACGSQGCLEAFVGTAAVLRAAHRAIRTGRSTLARLAAQRGGRLTPELVSQAAQAGDSAARRVWREVGGYLGRGLSNVINLLNPERIVIGGGIARAWPWFGPRLRETIRACAFEVPAKACRVVRAALGDDAGIVGAAVLVWDQTEERMLQ
jgi:glucokinase